MMIALRFPLTRARDSCIGVQNSATDSIPSNLEIMNKSTARLDLYAAAAARKTARVE